MERQGKRWAWLGLGAALALTLLLYLPTLGYYWAADDFNFAVKKELPQVLNFFNLARGNGFYRPLSWLSFVLDYELWGRNPFMWRLTNVIINLACAALVWLLAYRLRGSIVAALAALIFAAQPAHPGSVTWIDGRFDALATLMYLGCVTAFVMYMQTRRRLCYDLALVSLLLAILAKETGLTAPALLLLTDLLFFPQPGVATVPGHRWPKVHWLAFLRAKLWLYAPFIILGGGYLLLRLWLNAERLIYLGYGGGFRANNTLMDNVAGYLGMLLGLPSIVGLQGGAALAFVIGFGIVVIALAVWAGRLAWFGLAWVFVSMAPFANIQVFDQATRYVYLPSVGIALLLAAALGKGLGSIVGPGDRANRRAPLRWITAMVAMLIIGYGCLATVAHNGEWKGAGEMTQRFVEQLKAAHPTVAHDSRFFFTGVPFTYKRASVLNAGIIVAVQTTYDDFSLKVYPAEYNPGVFNATLQQPSSTPSYYFRFIGSTLKEYPNASALLAP